MYNVSGILYLLQQMFLLFTLRGKITSGWTSNILSNQYFGFLQICTKKRNCQVTRHFHFQFSEEPLHYFPQWLHQYAFLPTVHKVSLFCKFSSHQHLSVDIAFLTGVRWYLIVVLMHISPMNSDVEQFFMSIGHLYVHFGEIFIQVSAHFLIQLFICVELPEFFISFGY